jgi:hypothetical protein
MLFLIALLIHLASIALLFPELAEKSAPALDAIVVLQFPLMALAAVAHTIWDDEDELLRSRLARGSLTFGITFVCLLIFATVGISVGPADPFGAPESASLGMRAGWFVGFSLIASLGSRFFIATSVLEITEVLAGPMRRAPAVWLGVALGLGSALGGAAVVLMHSETVTGFAIDAQSKMDANPAPYIIGFLVVPMLLGGIAKALRSAKD